MMQKLMKQCWQLKMCPICMMTGVIMQMGHIAGD